MSVTITYKSKYESPIEQGPRGFPGPPGPVSGGVYPGAGIAVSAGSSWGTSITDNSDDGTPVHLQLGLNFNEINPIYSGEYTDDLGGVGY